jgi:hypothetical protein
MESCVVKDLLVMALTESEVLANQHYLKHHNLP